MAIPCSTLELENKKFVECPQGSGKVAVRTKICQDDGEILKVDIGVRGVSKNIYNSVNSIPLGSESLVVSYTVPVGKKFDLRRVSASGDNIARFLVKINGDTKQAKRTWWTNFNAEFDLEEEILISGDVVTLFVENKGQDAVSFEGTINGGEYDS